MNSDQPTSGAEVAAVIAGLVPGAAEVRLIPLVSDGSGETRCRTWTAFYAPGGVWIESVSREVSERVLRMLAGLPGRDVSRPQVFVVASAAFLAEPPAPSLPVVVPLTDAAEDGGR